MSKAIEVHRKVHNNVGDYFCNPSRYFTIDADSQELMHNPTPLDDKDLIVGGGGLIHKKFSKHIQMLLDKNPRTATLWGIGHNFGAKHVTKVGNVYYPDWIERCDLIGIRDWIDGYHKWYLPCVSCMHPCFSWNYEVRHETVYFIHAFKTKYESNGMPVMKNNKMNFEDVIAFLGSAETVVTDSYHGAYWAQLLGKNVHVSSWSVKFDHMKYQPNFIETINSPLPNIKNKVVGYLEECQQYNRDFYEKFRNITS